MSIKYRILLPVLAALGIGLMLSGYVAWISYQGFENVRVVVGKALQSKGAAENLRIGFAETTELVDAVTSMPQPSSISRSIPRSPNSLIRKASRFPPAFSITCRISVVLPAPRKPEMMVAGIFCAMVEESARDHIPDGINVSLVVDPDCDGSEPVVLRRPEFLQGIGNLVQNAGQFARTKVDLSILWKDAQIRLRIDDDGPGFPGWMLDSLGEPYVSSRAGRSGHLGLGIFIAQTLLDRTGALATYKNKREGGARIDIVWNRHRIEARSL